MASNKPQLKVIRAPTAIGELHAVWRWNAEHYGVDHADRYLRFLKDAIERLATGYAEGKEVVTRPDLRYLLIRRRRKGHGHVAVYNFDDKDVHILHIFHTAQDWPTKLANESGQQTTSDGGAQPEVSQAPRPNSVLKKKQNRDSVDSGGFPKRRIMGIRTG